MKKKKTDFRSFPGKENHQYFIYFLKGWKLEMINNFSNSNFDSVLRVFLTKLLNHKTRFDPNLFRLRYQLLLKNLNAVYIRYNSERKR